MMADKIFIGPVDKDAPSHKIELDTGDWKLVGQVRDVVITPHRVSPLLNPDKYKVEMSFQFERVDNAFYKVLTGAAKEVAPEAGANTNGPQNAILKASRPVVDLRRVLNGTS